MTKLKTEFAICATNYNKELKALVSENKDFVIDNITLDQLHGGLRDVISLITDTSSVDSEKGLTIRGHTIEDLCTTVPKNAWNSQEPLAEYMIHVLLLGKIPTIEDINLIRQDLIQRNKVPSYVFDILNKLPSNASPMVQFTTAISALETESIFNKAYHDGIKKDVYWEYIYEDSMNIIAMIPSIVSYIYNKNYNNGKHVEFDTNLDWSGNLAQMLGDKESSHNSLMKEFMRLYVALHTDHEGGNASANTCHLIGSTLASPYASLAGAMHSLSGPLHGLACQSSLEWLNELMSHHSGAPTVEETTKYIHESLEQGRVVPGYGHAVLRKTDPRFTSFMNFGKQHNLTSPLLETVWSVYEVAPKVLGSIGKIKNPFPNVDAHSGALLNYFGIKNPDFYTVLFGASRTIGVLIQQIWDRATMQPITRPKSVTLDYIKTQIKNSK
jgi:citrate synthase